MFDKNQPLCPLTSNIISLSKQECFLCNQHFYIIKFMTKIRTKVPRIILITIPVQDLPMSTKSINENVGVFSEIGNISPTFIRNTIERGMFLQKGYFQGSLRKTITQINMFRSYTIINAIVPLLHTPVHPLSKVTY